MTNDEEHLNLLSIFNYVFGGLTILGSFLPLIYVVMGLFFVFGGSEWLGGTEGLETAFMGWAFAAIGLTAFAFVLGAAICCILSGLYISKRKNYLFSFILACIQCAFTPFGTILGVFTIVVLTKDNVREMYSRNQPSVNLPPK